MKWKLFIALLIIVFGGGGTLTWYFFLREPPPEEVLRRMQAAMLEARSLHSETAFSADIDLSELQFKGRAESFSPFIPSEREITINLLVTGDNEVDHEGLPVKSQATLELYTSPQPLVRLAGEVRAIDKTTYFKLNDVDFFLPLDFSKLKDEWYRADDLQKLTELEEKKEGITGEPAEGKWEEKIKGLRTATARAVLFDVLERSSDDSLDGVPTRHYSVKLAIPGIRAYLEELFKIFEFEQTEQGRAFLDRLMIEAENARGELWIGRRDFRLYKSTILWPLRYVAPEDRGAVNITASLTVKNSKFNESVEVDVPPDARGEQEFMQKLLGGFLGGLTGGLPASGDRVGAGAGFFGLGTQTLPGAENEPATENVGDADSDSDGFTDVQEGFWGSDPQNPDTDGDGHLDGAEVENGYSPTGPGRLF